MRETFLFCQGKKDPETGPGPAWVQQIRHKHGVAPRSTQLYLVRTMMESIIHRVQHDDGLKKLRDVIPTIEEFHR